MDDSVRIAIDTEHLRLLRLGYLITAAWDTLYAAVFVTQALAVSHLTSKNVLGAWSSSLTESDARILRLLFSAFAFVLAGAIATMVVLKLIAAQALKRHHRRWLCIIIGAVSCLHIPYGTVLGVATLMVLSRESIARLFDVQATIPLSRSPGEVP